MTTTTDRFFDAKFTRVRDAKLFALRIGESGWHVVPGSIRQVGRTVSWEWTGEGREEDEVQRRLFYFQDMLETVGYYGTAPSGRLKATLNGVPAPPSY